MSDVTLKSVSVRELFFFFFSSWLLFGWCFCLLVLSTPLPYLYQFSQSKQGFEKSQHTDSKGLPFWGLEHSLKTPNCERCSLEVSHGTFVHNTQSQHFRRKKNTSIVMTLIHFCSALASQFEASNFQVVSLCRPEKCALSSEWKRKPPRRLNTNTRGRTDLSTGRKSVVCVAGPSHGCGARWWAERAPGVADTHTHTHNSSWGPSCCWAVVMAWQAGSEARPCGQRPVAGYSSW